MTRPDLVLHLGPSHDATSMLHDALITLRPQLRHLGVACTVVPQNGSATLRELLAAERAQTYAVRHGPCPTLISCALPLADAAPDLATSGAGPYPHASDDVGRVVEAVGALHTLVYLHVERQDHLMERGYAAAVLAGGSHEFADQFPRRYEPFLDYGVLVRRLQSVPGVFAIRVRPIELAFADSAEFVDDVLEAVGVRGDVDLGGLPPDIPASPACTARGIRIAAAMNAQLDDDEERASVRSFVLEHFAMPESNVTRAPGLLKERERARVLDAHAHVNDALYAAHMPRLPSGSYRGDTATSAAKPLRPAGRP